MSPNDHPLQIILNPRSVAIAGASNNLMKMGTSQALSLLNQGYAGEVCFIHPTEPRVLDRPTYASPRDLPAPVDLAILIVPTRVVPALLDDFGHAGVRHAVIVSGGFREMGDEGRALEQEVRDVAARHGIRFVGPNCIGVINMAARLNCTYFPNPSDAPGVLGLISQSGTYVTQVQSWLADQRVGIAQAVSVGNQADLDAVDVLEHFATQDDVRAVALYLESLPRGERFVEVARRVRAEAGKPLVALYVGGSGAGARAGASHTGALAAPDDIMEGLLRQAGVVRVHSVADLYHQSWMLATQPPMRGPRVGVVTHSGGPAATIADAAERHGLELPTFSEALQARLREHLPATGQTANPVDMTYLLELSLLTGALPRTVLESGEVDGLVIHGIAGAQMGRLMFENVRPLLPEGTSYEVFKGFLASGDPLAPLLEMPRAHGLPIVHSAFHDRHDEIMGRVLDAGIPTVESPEQTAVLLARSLQSHRLAERIRASRSRDAERRPAAAPAVPAEAAALLAAAREARRPLAEHEAKALLRAWELPVVPEREARTADDAAAAAAALGFPVALKLSAAGLAHKTELGAVRLGLGDEDAVRRAAAELLQLGERLPAAERTPEAAAGEGLAPRSATAPRLLVAPMLADPRELVAGLARRPELPSCVMFGWGGIFTETLADTAWRLAPFDEREAEAMIDETRAARLLEGVRGYPPVHRDELARLLVRLGQLGRAHPEIRSVDANPILVDPDGHPVVADALIELA